jgi:hypothetical protein
MLAIETLLGIIATEAFQGVVCDCGHLLDEHWEGDCLQCSCINGRPIEAPANLPPTSSERRPK